MNKENQTTGVCLRLKKKKKSPFLVLMLMLKASGIVQDSGFSNLTYFEVGNFLLWSASLSSQNGWQYPWPLLNRYKYFPSGYNKKVSPDISKYSLWGQICGSPEPIIYVNLLNRCRRSMKDKKKQYNKLSATKVLSA